MCTHCFRPGKHRIKRCPPGTPNVACFPDSTLSDWGIVFCVFICICVFACEGQYMICKCVCVWVHLPTMSVPEVIIRCLFSSPLTLFIESVSLKQTKSLPTYQSRQQTAPCLCLPDVWVTCPALKWTLGISTLGSSSLCGEPCPQT